MNAIKSPKNQETIKTIQKSFKKFSTCTNDLRISGRIKEQHFTSFRNCPKMTEYYVNAQKWTKNKETHTNDTKKCPNFF